MVVAITKTESNTNKMQGTCVVTAVNVRICLDFDALWRSHPLNWKPILRFPFQKRSNQHGQNLPWMCCVMSLIMNGFQFIVINAQSR